MNWNLKDADRRSGWRNFFERISFRSNQSDLLYQNISIPNQGPQAILEKVLKPSAQRIFADLHNYLVMKITTDTPSIVLICTANPAEGASSVALGLAAAAARDKQEKILLIDGNFHRPSLCEAWNLKDNLGFFDLLTGTTNNINLAQQTRLGNLWVMGAGSSIESQSRDLEPGNLKKIFDQLASLYTLVIIDGPPLNTHPESNLYAQYATNVLLIIAAGLSRAPVVHNAIAKFPPQVRDKLEVVLNRRIYPIPDSIYRKLWTS
jgi:protein-tyrosine kinase